MNKKLNYKKIIYKNVIINFARSRCRTLHLSIRSGGEVYYVVPYWVTKESIYNFLDEKLDWIIKKVDIYKNIRQEIDTDVTKEELKILNEKVNQYIKKYEPLLNVKVEKYSFRKMKTLWGSCTCRKRTIRFNKNLAKKSDEFIEYIVLHEMTHILVPNHSKRFYDIIKKYIPNYKQIKKM